MAAKKQRGLGRGLNALMNNEASASSATRQASTKKKTTAKKMETEPEAGVTSGVLELDVQSITANPYQPRQRFDEEALEDLTNSIKEVGILQPLTVRPGKKGSTYQLIAGERRFRAAQRAGLKQVPVVVREFNDQEALELALVENLQRHDLNIIEEAEGYQQLAEEFGLTQEQIAKRVGKGRATVANALRLLQLSATIRDMVADGRLTAGHAKAILSIESETSRISFAEQAVREQWSVRETEKRAAEADKPAATPKEKPQAKLDIPADHLQHLTDQLHQHFGTSVRIHPSKTLPNGKKQRGRLEVDFYSNEDLDRLLDVLGLSDSL